jgi:hypothetical protein
MKECRRKLAATFEAFVVVERENKIVRKSVISVSQSLQTFVFTFVIVVEISLFEGENHSSQGVN